MKYGGIVFVQDSRKEVYHRSLFDQWLSGGILPTKLEKPQSNRLGRCVGFVVEISRLLVEVRIQYHSI